LHAEDPENLLGFANSAYERGQYAEAVSYYQQIIDGGIESGGLHYNLGNAFFRMNKIGL
jgi:hypothetical protein